MGEMRRGGPKPKGLTRYYGVRFHPETITELERLSEESERSVSWLIREIVVATLEAAAAAKKAQA
jgi:predicted DNA-binding protein